MAIAMDDFADLIGVPFQYEGRGPDTYDCYGLVMECCRRTHGVEIPDVKSPHQIEEIAAVLAGQLPSWREVEAKPGVVAVFRVKGYGAHVGFLLGRDRFLHTWERSGGVCIERLSHWKNRVFGFYEYVGS